MSVRYHVQSKGRRANLGVQATLLRYRSATRLKPRRWTAIINTRTK
jgi:hypothetical protein